MLAGPPNLALAQWPPFLEILVQSASWEAAIGLGGLLARSGATRALVMPASVLAKWVCPATTTHLARIELLPILRLLRRLIGLGPWCPRRARVKGDWLLLRPHLPLLPSHPLASQPSSRCRLATATAATSANAASRAASERFLLFLSRFSPRACGLRCFYLRREAQSGFRPLIRRRSGHGGCRPP